MNLGSDALASIGREAAALAASADRHPRTGGGHPRSGGGDFLGAREVVGKFLGSEGGAHPAGEEPFPSLTTVGTPPRTVAFSDSAVPLEYIPTSDESSLFGVREFFFAFQRHCELQVRPTERLGSRYWECRQKGEPRGDSRLRRSALLI